MKDISWAACLRLGATAAVVHLLCAGGGTLAALSEALAPLLIGGGVACVVNIPMTALERRLFPRGGRLARITCLTLAFVAVIAVAAWLIGAILPEALQCVTLLAARLPEAAAWLTSRLQGWLPAAGLPGWQELAEHGAKLAMEASWKWLGSAADALSALTAGAADALLALILAVYLLSGKERIAGQLTRLTRRMLGETALRRITAVASALSDAFRAYTVGQCAEAAILGCLCLIGMLLLRLPGALPISAMAGVTALLPLVGAPLAAGIGAILLLPESLSASVTFVVFFLALQQVESGFIGPRIAGANLGLPPVWTLTAMLLGGGLSGLPGAVLAVPVAAAARTLLIKEPEP